MVNDNIYNIYFIIQILGAVCFTTFPVVGFTTFAIVKVS